MGTHPKQSNVVWTPELAYAVGLITTDGCLSPNGRNIDFTSKDWNLIETFKKCLHLTNKIGTKKNGHGQISFRVQFGNILFYRWLQEIGLTPRKSKILGPLAVPDEFFFDFLRGHLDGDGSIARYQDPVWKNSTRLYVRFMSASQKHMEWLKMKITELGGVNGFMQLHSEAYYLSFSKYEAITLLNKIYPRIDVPCLERKFVIAQEFLMPR
jgi:hypothetical protein